MDSMRRDLRDTLAEIDPETDLQVSEENTMGAGTTVCYKCRSFPAPGSKLRYCGRCKTAAYRGE